MHRWDKTETAGSRQHVQQQHPSCHVSESGAIQSSSCERIHSPLHAPRMPLAGQHWLPPTAGRRLLRSVPAPLRRSSCLHVPQLSALSQIHSCGDDEAVIAVMRVDTRPPQRCALAFTLPHQRGEVRIGRALQRRWQRWRCTPRASDSGAAASVEQLARCACVSGWAPLRSLSPTCLLFALLLSTMPWSPAPTPPPAHYIAAPLAGSACIQRNRPMPDVSMMATQCTRCCWRSISCSQVVG